VAWYVRGGWAHHCRVRLDAWTWDPTVLLGLLLAASLYAVGWRRLRHRSHRTLSRWQPVAFGSGLLVVLLALLSPIGTYDQELFALHMTQHMLLIMAAAPLLLLGQPLVPLLWGLPDQERRGLGRLLRPRTPLHAILGLLGRPVVAETLFLLALGIWHVPRLYDAAEGRTWLHDFEHLCFFLTAILFWWPVVQPAAGQRSLGRMAAIVYLLPAMMEGTAIGALLTLSSQPLYATYRVAPRLAGLAGLSPLDDQQLAGLIMWVPGGLIYAGCALCLLLQVLHDEQASTQPGPAQPPMTPLGPA
jgi:cytochrome c oxidase assembly factor CtaG